MGSSLAFCDEATVGAGLPVLATLQDMVRSGDGVHALGSACGSF